MQGQHQLSLRSGSPHNQNPPIIQPSQIFQQQIAPGMTIPSAHSTVQSQVQQSIAYQQFPPNLYYDDVTKDEDPEIQQEEELSIDNKLSLNKISLIVGIIMLICSLILFFMAVAKIDSDSHPLIYQTYQFFVYLGIGMIVCSLLQIINSYLNSGKITKGKSQSFFGKFAHFCCVLILGLQITVIFFCILLIKVAPQVWITEFLDKYWYTLFLCQIVFSCSTLFIMHSTFQFNRRPATARIMIYLLLSCQLIIGFWIMCQVKTVLNSIKIHNISDIISRDLLTSIIVIIIVAFVLFLILLLVNYSKQGVWLFYFGTLLIILVLVFINISGVVYRQALDLQKNYEQEESSKCYFSLDLINQDLIKKYKCTKYTEVESSPYLSCEENHQFIMWEPETTIGVESRINKRVCLNDKCCKSASLIIIKEIVSTVLLNFYFCYCLFMIAIYCFYLIPKHKHERSLQRPLEFLFLFVFICLSIVLIILIANKTAKIDDVKDYIILADQIEIQKSKAENVYLVNNFLHNEKCGKFLEKIQSLSKQFNPVSVSSTKWLRVELLTKLLDIQVNQLFNEEDLQILLTSKNSIIQQFYNVPNDEYHFLLVQGERQKVINFFEMQVYLCSLTSNTQLQVVLINTKEISKETLANSQQINIASQQDYLIELETIEEFNRVGQKLITPQLTGGGQFTSIIVNIYSLNDSQPLEGVVIDLSKVLSDNECPEALPDNEINYKAETNKKGQAKFTNIQQSVYFIHYSKPGYHSNCFKVGGSEIDEISLGMIKQLEDNKIALIISYETVTEYSSSKNTFDNYLQLNLYGAFTSAGKECITGSGFSECGGIIHKELAKQKHSQTTAILLTLSLSDQNYLFYLKNIIEKKDYDRLTDLDKTKINQLWKSRSISLSYFVSDCISPAYFKQQLDIQENTQNKKENNLAYLLGCVKAKKNNQFLQINKYWIGQEVPQFTKKENQQFPFSGNCENYELNDE